MEARRFRSSPKGQHHTGKQGSEAVDLPAYLIEGIEEYEYIITQFAPIGKK